MTAALRAAVAEGGAPTRRAAPKERAAAGAQPGSGDISDATQSMKGVEGRVVKSRADLDAFMWRVVRSGLSDADRVFALALGLMWIDRRADFAPSYAEIAKELGMSRRTAIRRMATLRAAGLISAEVGKSGRASRYELVAGGDTQ
ncbi:MULTISPECIES: helix-turn-helix domain-containing protein [Hyphomicrobiales]|jgi:hypothetical protein|uniref:helix-turn-helix domain-containing protein n=1 Tax=Methylobacterium sp. CCH7-A2 TaxID=1768789 RepID=UPI0009EBA865|nr:MULTISPECIES: helix-turn-helix domain-containing protein [Hyphomicrobiales]